MRRRRGTVVGCCGLILSMVTLWFAIQARSTERPITMLVPGEHYAVDVGSEQTEFDLEFSSDSRYVLVVSSLGDAGRTHSVEIQAESVPAVSVLPVRWLGPFEARRLHSQRRTATETEHGSRDTVAVETSPTRGFHLHVTDGELDDPKQYVVVRSRPVAENDRVRVYLDVQQHQRELAPGIATEVARLLGDEIIPRLQRRLGVCRDVDGDGKFTVLLTPWLSRLQGGRTSLGGFVRGSDFRGDAEAPFGNRCDMLYLNSTVQPGPHLRTLLAHEFTHAICFSKRLPSARNRFGFDAEEDWLNEAIAHLSENLDGEEWSNLHYRISRFLNAPQEFPLVVGDYYRAGLWRNHGCRGATFLFLRWCVDQYGEELLRRLIRCPVGGIRNLEWATGVRFEELYRRWSIALMQSDLRKLPQGAYHSMNLHAPLAGWGLAGPRYQVWNVDAGPQTVRLRGTATAFLDLEPPVSSGVRRIRLKAAYGTKLQVSLVKCPKDWSRFRIEAEWSSIGIESTTGQPAKRMLSVRATSLVKTGSRVEFIACEQNDGETKQSFCFSGPELVRFQTATTVAGENEGDREYRLPVAFPAASTIPIVIKTVVRNRSGRRSTAWTVIEPAGKSQPKLQVARITSR